jgi:hypothetical protein
VSPDNKATGSNSKQCAYPRHRLAVQIVHWVNVLAVMTHYRSADRAPVVAGWQKIVAQMARKYGVGDIQRAVHEEHPRKEEVPHRLPIASHWRPGIIAQVGKA